MRHIWRGIKNINKRRLFYLQVSLTTRTGEKKRQLRRLTTLRRKPIKQSRLIDVFQQEITTQRHTSAATTLMRMVSLSANYVKSRCRSAFQMEKNTSRLISILKS